MTVSPTKSQIQTVLVAFLTAILPSGVEIDEGQDNRVSQPTGADFIIFTERNHRRISTNLDVPKDVVFTGFISGSVLTVTAMQAGTIAVGANVYGVSVLAGTEITSQGSGTGGVGTYNLNNSQTVVSETMAAGFMSYTQSVEITYQVDVYGPNSSDNSVTISTLFRDDFAVEQFAALSSYPITPLYADDPKQVPFIDENQQYETRWIVEAVIQVDQTIQVTQQFAGAVSVTIKQVEATFHP